MMTDIGIQELHDLRRSCCNCRKQYVTPAFHDQECPYTKQGEDLIRTRLEKGGEDHGEAYQIDGPEKAEDRSSAESGERGV